MKKVLLIIGSILAALIIIWIIVYAVNLPNRNYGKQVLNMIDDSNKKWQNQISSSGNKLDSAVNLAKVMQDDSKAKLEQLNSLAVPSKGAALQTKVREYYTISGQMAAGLLELKEYSDALAEANKGLDSINMALGKSKDEIIRSFEEAHNTLSAAVGKLQILTPPVSYKTFHSEYTGALDKLDQAIVKFTQAAKDSKVTDMESAQKEMEAALNQLKSLSAPTNEEVMAAIVSTENQNRFKNLPDEIKAELRKLL